MKLNGYTSHHNHSSKSFGDSIYPTKQLVKDAKAIGYVAATLTDHGSLVSQTDFFEQCEETGIKPIIGMEAYYANDEVKSTEKKSKHLLVLVENEIGYKNLLKLTLKSSIPVKDGGTFFVKPRFTDKEVFKYQEGLIFSSACLNGVINKSLMDGDELSARIEADKWKNNVDNFYIEIMPHKFPEQIAMNQKLIEIATDMDIPLLCTLDVHYQKPEQHKAWAINGAIRRRETVDTFNSFSMEPDMYFKSIEQIVTDLKLSGLTDSQIEESINNSVRIADQCNFKWLDRKQQQPVFNADLNAADHLKKIAWQGLCKRFNGAQNVPKEYMERLKLEWEVISTMGYADYFLILHDMIYFAKSTGVNVGPGRGSACGSMMLWALYVTEVDSLKYNLPFERFLNPSRVDALPD